MSVISVSGILLLLLLLGAVVLGLLIVGVVLAIVFATRKGSRAAAAPRTGEKNAPPPVAEPVAADAMQPAAEPTACPCVPEESPTLAETLRSRRVQSGMTQELVAEHMGVSRQAVSKWESGLSEPSTANLLALARLYGISADELLRRADPD